MSTTVWAFFSPFSPKAGSDQSSRAIYWKHCAAQNQSRESKFGLVIGAHSCLLFLDAQSIVFFRHEFSRNHSTVKWPGSWRCGQQLMQNAGLEASIRKLVLWMLETSTWTKIRNRERSSCRKCSRRPGWAEYFCWKGLLFPSHALRMNTTDFVDFPSL